MKNKTSVDAVTTGASLVEESLDLNSLLIKRPASTFVVKVSGDSMLNGGILSGDLLVVDRSLHGCDNNIVIAAVNGEMTVKRLVQSNDRWILRPDNPSYPDIIPDQHADFFLWGVVTAVVRKGL